MKRKHFFRVCGGALAFALVTLGGSAGFAQETAQPPTPLQTPPQAPDGMRLFLLIGQSNMAGRGKVEAQDEVTDPRIWMLTKDLTWAPARDPLHFDKPGAGVGPASEFARTLVKAQPNMTIGLIPCAVGGSSLDQWKAGGSFYKNAVTRAKEAMKKGTLAGILWHQGESDRAPARVATYPLRFTTMIAQLRQDLEAPDVPLVMGELGRFRPDQEAFNGMLPGLVQSLPHCGLATAEDLTDRGDKLHFDSASQRTFGRRYAAVYQRLQAGEPAPK